MRNTVYLLGGQGSQYFGMASSLYEENAEFRGCMDRLDAVCTSRYGRSVTGYLYDPERDRADPCDDLALSNAAIFMVEYSLGEVLRSMGIRPDVLVGSSLGEFVTLAVAGRVPPDVCLGFVFELGKLLADSSRPPGGMLAVIGDPKLYEELPALHQHTEMASVNHKRHFVLSGEATGVRHAAEALKSRDLLAVPLPVRFAFHSSALDGMREQITQLAESLTAGTAPSPSPSPATDPVLVSSATRGVVTGWDAGHSWNVIRRPIAFTEAISAVPAASESRFIDLTPSSTLSTLMKTSHPTLRTYPVMTQFGTETSQLKTLRAELLT